MKQAGFTRHIGVSNFTVALIDEAVGTRPSRWSPTRSSGIRFSIKARCGRHAPRTALSVTAYSPIARGKAAGDKELRLIGLHHRKTAAQVCLRFLLQEGAIVIPRTSKVERLSENLNVSDFVLDDAEMDEIRKLASPDGRMVTMGSAPEWD